jgi:hypothetical protein
MNYSQLKSLNRPVGSHLPHYSSTLWGVAARRHLYEVVMRFFQVLAQYLFFKPDDPLFVHCKFSFSGLWFHLPSDIHVCCCCVVLCVGMDANCNFSAVRSPIELKLSGELSWYPRIACMFWFQDLIIFYIVNKQKNKKTRKSRRSWFYKTCVFSAVPNLIDVKLGGDIQTSSRNSVVCLFWLYYCLFTFCKRKQRKHTLWISRPSLNQMF